MGAVNKQMNPQDIQKTLQNFEKESMKMDMSEEMSKITQKLVRVVATKTCYMFKQTLQSVVVL